MPRGLTFFPQPLLAAAEEHDAVPRERLAQRLAVHVAHHEDRTAESMLNDGGQEPGALGEIQAVDVCQSQRLADAHAGRTSIPAARSSRLRSPIAMLPL